MALLAPSSWMRAHAVRHALFRAPRFFISYRRGDIPDLAAELYKEIAGRYSGTHAFLDVDVIIGGDDFRAVIQRSIERCDCVIAVVGPKWTGPSEHGAQLRIFNDGDFVRFEIAEALKQGKPLFVLYRDTVRLNRTSLPGDIARLAREKWIDATNQGLDQVLSRIVRLLRLKLSWRIPALTMLAAIGLWAFSAPALLDLGRGGGERPDTAPLFKPGSPLPGLEQMDLAEFVTVTITRAGDIIVQAGRDPSDGRASVKPSEVLAAVRAALQHCRPRCPSAILIRGDRLADASIVFAVLRQLDQGGLRRLIATE